MATVHDHESRIAQLEAELAKVTALADRALRALEELAIGLRLEIDWIPDYSDVCPETDAPRSHHTGIVARLEDVLAGDAPTAYDWLEAREARNA